MRKNKISKEDMAEKLETSRSSLIRFMDTVNFTVNLQLIDQLLIYFNKEFIFSVKNK